MDQCSVLNKMKPTGRVTRTPISFSDGFICKLIQHSTNPRSIKKPEHPKLLTDMSNCDEYDHQRTTQPKADVTFFTVDVNGRAGQTDSTITRPCENRKGSYNHHLSLSLSNSSYPITITTLFVRELLIIRKYKPRRFAM